VSQDTLNLVHDLCKFRTAVVADDNIALLERIGQELAIELFAFQSDETHNGWVIPKNWRVQKADVFHEGTKVFDGKSNSLGVGFYSTSFHGELDYQTLKKHVITNPELPAACMFHCMWQYRPWEADWVLSIPYSMFKHFNSGPYRVELETVRNPGQMLVAHHHKTGRSDKIIVFNAHTCHPHMANDGVAGVAVLIRLFQWLAEKDTYYSYRLVLGPEHLGSVFYLRDRPTEEVDRMVCGVFAEMPGTSGALKATATFPGGQMIDKAFANALRHYSKAHVLVPWRKGAGNDETVWEAPGYEIPFVEITRCEDQWAPFREYHSSMDTADLMNPDQVDEMLVVLKKVVETLEDNVIIQRRFDGLICLSNPRYDLYMERPDPAVAKDLNADAQKWGHLLDCLFRYMDGTITLLDIAQRHDLPFDRLRRYLSRFEEKGLVKLVRARIPRSEPRRVSR
jgi:aminopeptidase-like protein